MNVIAILLGATALVAASCGSSSTAAELASETDTPAPEIDMGDLLEDPEGVVDEIVDSLAEQQSSQGGGSATFVVGDQEWTFSPVLCAFGPDEIGQEGAEFVLSSIQDGAQLYVSIDSFGHFISLNDITDFENPSVDLGSYGDGSVELDGRTVTAEMDFIDGTVEEFITIPGTFEATCP